LVVSSVVEGCVLASKREICNLNLAT
jgi:hypothetical protein